MCDERERLIGYVYDECDDDERRAIASHLEDCGTCRAEIGGLRRVRQDLLAWDVPEPKSVWRPPVTPIVMPWYRQVPAWAMAAAATIMFAVGITGGLVANTLTTTASPAVGVATEAPLSSSEIIAVAEQRALERFRAEVAATIAQSQPQRVSVSDSNHDGLMQRVTEIVGQSEQRQAQIMLDIAREWSMTSSNTKDEVKSLREALQLLADAIAGQGGGGR